MKWFIVRILWFTVFVMIILHYAAQEDCNRNGGLYYRESGEFFYKCVPDDLELVWENT